MADKYKTDGKFVTSSATPENFAVACAITEEMAEKIAAALNFYEQKGNGNGND